jgi:YD repeat-containing protein
MRSPAVGLGRTGLGRSGSRRAIEPKIVLAHQSHPFRGRYDLAGSIILNVNPDANRHEQDRNAYGSRQHDNLLAVESAFAPDSDPNAAQRKDPEHWPLHS